MKKAVIGNWKMNGQFDDFHHVEQIATIAQHHNHIDVALCIPDILLGKWQGQTSLSLGGQNCHAVEKGAFTGDSSIALLTAVGADYVIVGHSERRAYQGETNQDVSKKAAIVHKHNLKAILCIGETEAEYRAGNRLDVVKQQLGQSLPEIISADHLLIAYEPVWAIGTGLIPTADEIAIMHQMIYQELCAKASVAVADKIRILYGGSVNPKNVQEISEIAHVSGVLVGGASLTADNFIPLIKAFAV